MTFSKTWRQVEAALRFGKSPFVLPMPKESYREPAVGVRIFVVDLNRPRRDLQTGQE